MLKREHLNLRRSGGYVKLAFAAPTPANLAIAEDFCKVCRQASERRQPRGEVEELLSAADRFSSGCAAILLKRMEFAPASNLDYPAMRHEIFSRAARILAANPNIEFAKYRELVAAPDLDVYGDLPENELCVGFNSLPPAHLIDLYNLQQIQTLLTFADDLELTLKSPPPPLLRNLFKQLNFCRLLAEVSSEKATTKITVSGPIAIFGETRKYALQLGMFFPAVLPLPVWKLKCTVRLPNRAPAVFTLDNSNPVVMRPAMRRYQPVVPEEIAVFGQAFKAKFAKEFELLDDPEFTRLPDGGMVFPDFSFRSLATGRIYSLELFHRYRGRHLEKRLALLAEGKLPPTLILGVDRALLAGLPGGALPTGESDQVFLYGGYPGADRVCGRLKSLDGISL